MVPMHLGFIAGPFVAHNLISIQDSPVPLTKFQIAPRLKILMASGSKKGTQIYFSYLSKVPTNKPPPGSLLQFPQNGAPMERDAHLQSLFYVFIRVPSKGVLPPGSLHRAPTERERDTSPLRAPLNHISKSLVEEPTPGCPTEQPREEMPIPRALLF
jgi:hypothetical protein